MSKLVTVQRRDYEADLGIVSPLHIGTGRDRDDLLPPIAEGGLTRKVPVAAIVRDHNGAPYLPGSTLKGAFRALVSRCACKTTVEALFGTIKNDGQGRQGALYVWGARRLEPGPPSGLPYEDDGVFVMARTAIDRGRGTSDTNKLFHSEAVSPRTRFRLRLRLEGRGDLEEMEIALLAGLGYLASKTGSPIGAETASGLGVLHLDGPVLIRQWATAPDGTLIKADEEKRALSCPIVEEKIALKLRCEGPYLSSDPSWTKETRRKVTAQEEGPDADQQGQDAPHLKAVRSGEVPFVTGTSVSGAMRARLDWLVAIEAFREQGAEKDSDEPVDASKEVTTLAQVADLSPVERLFGVTGWKAVLTVAVTKVKAAEPVRLTSVRIDRFSGGVIDNALFTVDADLDTELHVILTIDQRRSNESDKVWRDRLIDDLCKNGLNLGHGTGRGFGWFKVIGRS